MAGNTSKSARQRINMISADEVQKRILEQRELSKKKQEEKEGVSVEEVVQDVPKVVDTYEDFKDTERIVIQNPIIPGKKIKNGFFGRFLG